MSLNTAVDRIGFIGLGQIGVPMADRLLQAGYRLAVFDIRPEAAHPLARAGADIMASPQEVADHCGIVCLSLLTLNSFREVLFAANGLVHGSALRTIVNTSTVGRPFTEQMAATLSARRIELVDCPIAGGVPAAVAGSLSVMVSGDPAAVEKVRPYLDCWGSVVVVGDKPGPAQVLKLANNLLSAVALAATSEVMVMGVKAGLDPLIMLAAINKGSGRNSATEDKFPRAVLTRTFKYGGKIEMLAKDLALAVDQAAELGVPMPVCQAARRVYELEMSAGAEAEDITTIVRRVEQAAGFEIPKTR